MSHRQTDTLATWIFQGMTWHRLRPGALCSKLAAWCLASSWLLHITLLVTQLMAQHLDQSSKSLCTKQIVAACTASMWQGNLCHTAACRSFAYDGIFSSDMGSSNLACWNWFEMEVGRNSAWKTSVVHPADPFKKLFFAPDVPHLIKNVCGTLCKYTVFHTRSWHHFDWEYCWEGGTFKCCFDCKSHSSPCQVPREAWLEDCTKAEGQATFAYPLWQDVSELSIGSAGPCLS